MAAIKMALENVRQLEQICSSTICHIFTDSLSTIDNLASSRSRSRPNLLSDVIDLLHNINSQISVVWVPSHIGITGNERADRLANMAANDHTSTSTLALNCRKCMAESTLTSTSCGNRHGTTRQLDDTSTTSSQMSSAEIEYFSRRDRQKSSRIDYDSENADSTPIYTR